jgi:hypothetical protein
MSTQIRDLYPKVFVSPTSKISSIVESKYKQAGVVRSQQSTLVTLWVGINDIDLTYGWKDADALDSLIMQRYQVLIVSVFVRAEMSVLY